MSPERTERKQESAVSEVADTDGPAAQTMDNADAIRIRRRREEAATLNATLARLRCPNCGQTGCWYHASSPKSEIGEDGRPELRERWYKCRGCAQSQKVVLPES